ncbi:uncharacterized protein LOC136082202 [Hydra vulgaris]|uniref:Uncharacterized protein LOC136082202 n=1 Tax=Hydra vulgaris TaxID=6087 RepID=A0ABM4C5F0_HYDVU
MDLTMENIEQLINLLLEKQKITIIEESHKLLKELEKSFTAITTANLKIITERVNKLETDVINSSTKIVSITKAMELSNQKIMSLENELYDIKKFLHVNDETVASKFEKVKEQTKKVSSQMKDTSAVNKTNNKLREIEDRSRRNNLTVTGINESEHESWEENKIDIMKRSVRLKGMNIYINEDFCYETVQIRKDLRDKMLRERKQGKYAFISYDKLIIREWAEKKIDAKNRQV